MTLRNAEASNSVLPPDQIASIRPTVRSGNGDSPNVNLARPGQTGNAEVDKLDALFGIENGVLGFSA